MRIRGTKPEFWQSDRIASVSWEDRLVLKGLESYVDDNGVGKDDVELITSALFPRDLIREPSRTFQRVTEAISHLHQAGLVWRYEAEGERLLFISFWEAIQRVDKPQAGRFPRPDGTWNYRESVIRESSRALANPPEVLAPVTGEQGNRGTGEQDVTHLSKNLPSVGGSGGKQPAQARGCRLPDGWTPRPDVIEQMCSELHASREELHRQHLKFTDHWHAKSGQAAVKRDWNAAWRNWMRTSADRGELGRGVAAHVNATDRKMNGILQAGAAAYNSALAAEAQEPEFLKGITDAS